MEVLLGLIILRFALLGIARYGLCEYRGDVPLDVTAERITATLPGLRPCP
jgi:hypothetical protein